MCVIDQALGQNGWIMAEVLFYFTITVIYVKRLRLNSDGKASLKQ